MNIKLRRPDTSDWPARLWLMLAGTHLPILIGAAFCFYMYRTRGGGGFLIGALVLVAALCFHFWFYRVGLRLRRKCAREFRARCHWQNLNEKGREEVTGSIWRHGRAWFHRKLGREAERRGSHRTVGVEWTLWTHFWALQLELAGGDSDSDVSLWVACGLFSVHVTIEDAFPQALKDVIQYGSRKNARVVRAVQSVSWERKDYSSRGVPLGDVLARLMDMDKVVYDKQKWNDYMAAVIRLTHKGVLVFRGDNLHNPLVATEYDAVNGYWSRKIGIRLFEWAMWFSLWEPDGRWSATDPKWWSFTFHYRDFFLGSAAFSERELETARVDVPMPEGVYPATVVIREATWRRARWPWPKRIVRADITPDTPIPFPGKGENSYDCGMDATHSLTTAARTPAEAASKLAASVMESRERYGGRGWKFEGAA